MDKLNNIGHMTLTCTAGNDIWDGYQESRVLAEAMPINFVNYEFNEVKFPVKNSGAMVNYANREEMMALYNMYLAAPSAERSRVFLPKLMEAAQNSTQASVVDTPKTR